MEKKKITLTLPTSWEEISVDQFQEFIWIQENDKESRPYKKIIKQLSVITDTDEKFFYELPYQYIFKVQDNIGFLSQEPTAQFKYIIEHNGVKYGFQRNLNSLTLGEWIDLEHYTTNNIIQNLHYIAAILYRPITTIISEDYETIDYDIQKYDSEKVERYANIFKTLPITDVYGIAVFFYSFVEEFLTTSLTSSMLMMKQNTPEFQKMVMILKQKLEEEQKKMLTNKEEVKI